MREILFRGKRVDNGEWVEGDLTRRKSRFAPQLDTAYGVSDEFGTFRAIDPATAGQFTGLLDKNGRRVFEGDVLKPLLGDVHVVEWDGEECQFLGFWNFWGFRVSPVHAIREPMSEIIGNVHDNPELLEEAPNVD